MKEIVPEVKQPESEVEFEISERYRSSAWRQIRDKEVQKVTLERLRYKWYVRRGTLGTIMINIRKFCARLMGA